MSRTIITNSGSKFFTNISTEQFLGELCKEIGGVFYFFKHVDYESITMSYSMTEDDVLYVASEFRKLSERVDDDFLKKYKHYFNNDVNIDSFKETILYYADLFEKSKGYDCAS